MKARRGSMLVELLVLLSACSTVLTVSVVFLARVLRAQREATAVLDVQRAGWQLSTQFRTDVHHAVGHLLTADEPGAPVTEEPSEEQLLVRLRLTEDSTVDYRCRAGVVTRRQLHTGNVVRRDEFRLPEHAVVSIAEELTAPRRLTLSIDTPVNHALTPARFRIEAVVGCEPCPLDTLAPSNLPEAR